MKTGKITQISGPVVDVEFPDGDLPAIKEALTVTTNGKTRYMEVAFHVGNNVVRCIMFAETEGLARGAEVVATVAEYPFPSVKRPSAECSTSSVIR